MRALLLLPLLLLGGCGDDTVVGDSPAAANARTVTAEKQRARAALLESRFGGKGKSVR